MERLSVCGKIFAKARVCDSRLGIGMEKLDRDMFDPKPAYDKVAALGVKMVRIQSGWAKTEQQEGVYDFAWLDEIVDQLVRRGMQPWLCLCYGNPLYTERAVNVLGGIGRPPIDTEREMTAWLRYVHATVRHFKGRIGLYEIWNEPDADYSWQHEGYESQDMLRHAREYGAFASSTAQAIKNADENAKAAAFALAEPGRLQYVNEALAGGLYRLIDYITFHFYYPTESVRVGKITALRALADHYDPRIGLIQGESGGQSKSTGSGAMHGLAWSPEKQVKLLLRTMICDLWCDLAFTSYFSTMDMIEALGGVRSESDYGYFGVLDRFYNEKPAYAALQTLAALLGDAERYDMPFARECLPSRRLNGFDCDDDTIRTYAFRLKDGGTVLCYWNGTSILTDTYEGTVSFCVYGQNNEGIRLCDLRDGTLYCLPEDMIEPMGTGGVRLKNIPLTDAPLALVFGKEKNDD